MKFKELEDFYEKQGTQKWHSSLKEVSKQLGRPALVNEVRCHEEGDGENPVHEDPPGVLPGVATGYQSSQT